MEGIPVIALTILVSMCLAGLFISIFVLEFFRNKERGNERDSLLPFTDELPEATNKSSEQDKDNGYRNQ